MELSSLSHKCTLVAQPTGKADLTLKVCSECGKREFELTVDPVKFGVTF